MEEIITVISDYRKIILPALIFLELYMLIPLVVSIFKGSMRR